MNRLIRRHGIPIAIYSDRHPVFKFTGDIDRYPAGPTQFARAMEELGIRMIFARSPQAKGRVERAAATFQTGWQPSFGWSGLPPSPRPMRS